MAKVSVPPYLTAALLSAGVPPSGRTQRIVLSIHPDGTGEWILAVDQSVTNAAAIIDAYMTAIGENPTADGGFAANASVPDASEAVAGDDPAVSNVEAGTIAVPDASELSEGESPSPDGGLAAGAMIPDASETATGEMPTVDGGAGVSADVPDASEQAAGETPAPDGGLAATAGVPDASETAEGENPVASVPGEDYDFGFETGMDSWAYSGTAYSHARNGPDAAVSHAGDYMYAITTGHFEDPDDVYDGQGTLTKTMNTASGTMSVWIKCGGYSSPICRLTAGGTYTQTNLVAGWQQVFHTFTGATSDSVSIKVDNTGGYDDYAIDDIHIPIP